MKFITLLLSLFIFKMPLLNKRAVYAMETSCGIKNTSFKAGERIDYKIYYSVAGVYLEAGEVKFNCSVEQSGNRPVFHIRATGKTRPFYDKLYRVRDSYETFLDTGTLLSYRFIRHVEEGNVKKYERIDFNRSLNTAITDSGVYKIDACMQDVLGAMYFIRNMQVDHLKPGDKIAFSMFLDNRIYPSYIRYMGREVIKTRYGRFHAIKIKPLLIKGAMFEAGEKMTVWVTDDLNHVPVRIQSSIRIGSVKADLMAFENLRWPLVSLISAN